MHFALWKRDFQLLNDRWIVARFVKSSVAIAAQGTMDPLVGDDGTGELTVSWILLRRDQNRLYGVGLGFLVTSYSWWGLQWGCATERQSGAWIGTQRKGSRSGCHGSHWLWIVNLGSEGCCFGNFCYMCSLVKIFRGTFLQVISLLQTAHMWSHTQCSGNWCGQETFT